MSFNEGMQIDTSNTSTSGGGGFGGRGLAIGGGMGGLVIVVVAMFLGVDPSSILGQQNQAPQSSQGSSAYDLSKCKTGADANKYLECRIVATGNSVVLKPSEKSPLTAMRLAELAVEAGLPPGVFNVVPGYGHEAGEALALHMDVDAIGFTGSTRVGRKMLEYAGRSNLKRVYNELGGKSAFVVFDDFEDIARAAKTVAGSMFFNQGESCNAPSRVLVHEKVADRFLEVVAAEAPKYAPGDPLSGHAEMGALVDETQMKTVLGYIEAGNSEGAKLVTGGQRARIARQARQAARQAPGHRRHQLWMRRPAY